MYQSFYIVKFYSFLVHNQSPEQMERLKPRIQMHYVRRKTGTAENKISSEKKSSSAVNKSKPEKVSYTNTYTYDVLKILWLNVCSVLSVDFPACQRKKIKIIIQ